MAATASSLASQFSGLRREVLSREAAPSTALFVRSVRSRIRLPASCRPPRGVVAMAGTGKVPLLPCFLLEATGNV
ncbi:hypothetical protein GW17_00013261 [Ensete ventricosum]|nr:hypothetical protein GW17_00013261 [Ensete ventricosum]RZR89545.1 hypothetical protein BHM03_00017298 [Ensete ventricosum]